MQTHAEAVFGVQGSILHFLLTHLEVNVRLFSQDRAGDDNFYLLPNV